MSRRMKRCVFAACTALAVASASTSMLSAQHQSSGRQPRGWIGVYIESTALGDPVILSVEPGSPAERGGLTAGDTVLAYNTIAPRKDSSALERLLQPGRHLLIRVQHAGVRTVEVVVGKCPFVILRLDSVGRTVSSLQLSDHATTFVVESKGETPPCVSLNMMSAITREVIGLTFSSMNSELAGALHVDNKGVLVLQVAAGTPAMQARIKGGDVIVRADTTPVDTPDGLFMVIQGKMGQERHQRVVLHVLRAGKPRLVTLRW